MLVNPIGSTFAAALSAALIIASTSTPQQRPSGGAPSGAPSGAKGGAQGGGPVASAVPLRVEPPVIELGKIGPGSRHSRSFTLRNVSQAPLTIMETTSSCKCTEFTSLAGKVIPAGGILKLDATMEAPLLPGEKDAKVFIVVRGLDRPVIATIKGTIMMAIEAQPPFVDVRGGKLRTSVHVAANDGKPFRILSAGGKPPLVAATGAPMAPTTPAGTTFDIVSDFNGIPGDAMMQYWIIETDRDDCPIVPVQVRHELTGYQFDLARNERSWLFGESIANAGRLPVGKTYEGVVEITSFTPRDGPAPPASWGEFKSIKSLSPLATVELVSSEGSGDRRAIHYRFTPTAGAADTCIYVPVEVTTASGSGRFYVVASVRGSAASATGGAP